MKQITEQTAKKFKRNYIYKMGGTQTLVFPNGQDFTFNDKEFYSGRYANKYNNGIRHDDKGKIEITAKEVKDVMKAERERAKAIKQREIEAKKKAARIAAAKERGIYDLVQNEWCKYVELSEEESKGQYFDPERLAATLNIPVSDAELLKSRGKTYVFVKNSAGELLELYHSSLSCNDLSIIVTTATPERLAEFSPNEWQLAPFAMLVGQTTKANHFVC